MDIKGKKIGIALTGSFCTFDKMFQELQKLKDAGADICPIMSDASQTIESRFGKQIYISQNKRNHWKRSYCVYSWRRTYWSQSLP